MTHTPGPWYVGGGGLDIFTEDHRPIAACAALSVEGRGLGNARLVAAAPDLLAIAQQVAGLYLPDDDNPRDPSRGIAKLARAAIRKAEGRP